MNRRLRILTSALLVVILAAMANSQTHILSSSETTVIEENSIPTYATYLPHVTYPGGFYQNHPIWPVLSTPASHAVALFRRYFSLEEPLKKTELLIFADTRYQVWVDGTWVGRGPARFSEIIREYDIYELGDLQPGDHLIAVLVQWAPNTRRSESSTPLLLSHVQGATSKGREVYARTDSEWKALLSDAWQQDPAPVHEWALIGPTELVDLRKLPQDWMDPSFPDDNWPAAELKACLNGATYQPRSIPLLARAPMTATVISAGRLSPGYTIGELTPSISVPHSIPFKASEPTALVVEALTGTIESLAGLPSLDGTELDWERVGPNRPDVVAASAPLEAGHHSLDFADIPRQGSTFGISSQDISWTTIPFEQSTHAGRRLLLAKPSNSPEAVSVSARGGLPVTFETTAAYAVLDLGRVIHGRLEAEVLGPSGTVVDIGWDERLLTDNFRPLPHPGSLHPQWNQTDSWVLDGTSRSISTIDARAGRYILVAAWNGSPVELRDIHVYEERYPVVQQGEFHSSSARLDRIWQVGLDTLHPNMTDAYTDTPWRERGQWWGDAYVEEHINRVAFGDTALLRRGLLLMAEKFEEGRPPARAPNDGAELLLDYGMLWVQSLHDHYQITGDRELLQEVYPVLLEFMTHLEHYESASTGLLDMPFGHWWETALIDWRAPHSRYGQSTALNALYYGTLSDASQLAEAIDKVDDSLTWHQKARSLRDQLNAHLYLPAQHRYATTIFEGETLTPSVHAQAWPLAYGLVPEDNVADVSSALLELLPDEIRSGDCPRVGIYGMFWVLEALGHSGRIPEALSLIEAYYGGLLSLGATTWWEGFNSHLSYAASLSHGWGGGPTWFLTTYVLGIRRSGTHSWIMEPAFTELRQASGALPFHGDELRARWEWRSCSEAHLELTAPPDTTGEVLIPSALTSSTLTLDTRVIWSNGMARVDGISMYDEAIGIPVSQGHHSLYVHRDCEEVYVPAVLEKGKGHQKSSHNSLLQDR